MKETANNTKRGQRIVWGKKEEGVGIKHGKKIKEKKVQKMVGRKKETDD